MAEISKISNLTADYLVEYLRINDADDTQKAEIGTMLKSAVAYVGSYTGLTDEELDNHPEFVMAVCVLVQNQYDNRTFYTDKGQVEAVVSSVLGMHRKNLL